MTENRHESVDSKANGVVVQFPIERISPPPLPALRHTYPTPGMSPRSGAMFNAAASVRFDRNAA